MQPGSAADFRAPLDAGVSADWHQASLFAPYPSAHQANVDQRLDRLDTMRVLRQPHRPDEDAVSRVPQHLRKAPHVLACRAALPFEKLPVLLLDTGFCLLEARRVPRYEFAVDPSFGGEDFEDAVQERQVATGVYGEPGVRESRSENRRFVVSP